jgi:hypothetical protein
MLKDKQAFIDEFLTLRRKYIVGSNIAEGCFGKATGRYVMIKMEDASMAISCILLM